MSRRTWGTIRDYYTEPTGIVFFGILCWAAVGSEESEYGGGGGHPAAGKKEAIFKQLS